MNRKVLLALGLVVVLAGVVLWWRRDRAAADDDPAKPKVAERGATPDLTTKSRDNRRGDIDMPMRVMIDDDPKGALAGKAVFATVVPGGYQIAAWADGKAKAFQWIQIGAGDAEAKLALTAGAAVSGRVVDEHGTGIAGARTRYSGVSDWNRQGS